MRSNIFRKLIILMIAILFPVFLMYTLSYRTNTSAAEEQLKTSNLDQLTFLLHQIDGQIEQLSMFPIILSYDPYVRKYIDPKAVIDRGDARFFLYNKIALQTVSSNWENHLTLILPQQREFITSNIYLNDSEELYEGQIDYNWTYRKITMHGKESYDFIREVGEPVVGKLRQEADAVFQIKFNSHNIASMLDVYKSGRHNDPFLYYDSESYITNRSGAVEDARRVIEKLGSLSGDKDQRVVSIDGAKYLVGFAKSEQIGWYLVDYVPLKYVTEPIERSRNIFYLFIALLLGLGLVASFWLYRNIQVPIAKLVKGVKMITRGNYETRIEYSKENEFTFVIQHFNKMTEQIQTLIEHVYKEEIRSKDATVKQLQSQIHPHFLFNSLFFIINSAEMEDHESVIKMAENLAHFFRYSTRIERQNVTVREELDTAEQFLTIHQLRMTRLQYEIDVPPEMKELTIPRLLLQPIIENSIVHGFSSDTGTFLIRISGAQDERFHQIIIEDSGGGMPDDKMQQLANTLDRPMNDHTGCGTWNVHQRLLHHYGPGSGLSFSAGESGGLMVTLRWNREAGRSESETGRGEPSAAFGRR